MNKAGSGWMALGAVLAVVGLFLPWLAYGGKKATGWNWARANSPVLADVLTAGRGVEYYTESAADGAPDGADAATPGPNRGEAALPSPVVEPASDAEKAVEKQEAPSAATPVPPLPPGTPGAVSGAPEAEGKEDGGAEPPASSAPSAPSTPEEGGEGADTEASPKGWALREEIREETTPAALAEKGAALGQAVGEAMQSAGEAARTYAKTIQQEVRDLADNGLAFATPADYRAWLEQTLRMLRIGGWALCVTAILALAALWKALSGLRSAAGWGMLAGLWAFACLGAGAWWLLRDTRFGIPNAADGLNPIPAYDALARHAQYGFWVFFAGTALLFLGGLRLAWSWRGVGGGAADPKK